METRCEHVLRLKTDDGLALIDNANLSVVLPFGLSVTPSVEFYHTRSAGQTDIFVLLD